jgi:hypothetical protein
MVNWTASNGRLQRCVEFGGIWEDILPEPTSPYVVPPSAFRNRVLPAAKKWKLLKAEGSGLRSESPLLLLPLFSANPKLASRAQVICRKETQTAKKRDRKGLL